MNWKFWHRREKVEPALLDPDSVAYECVRSVVLGSNTFLDRWRKFSSELPSDIVPYLERCVWAYQLQILCDEVSRRFDPTLGDSVSGNLFKYFHMVSGGVSGEDLFSCVTNGRAMYSPGVIPSFADAPDVERTLVIANALFEISDIPEERRTGIWVGFAKCLGVAELAAEREFASFLDGISISKTSPLTWSRKPGCFERHLQRRFQNPLFDVNRREVSRSDIQEARVHDFKDAFDVAGECREFLPQLVSDAETTFGELTERWKRCDALKEKMAQTGGDWDSDREVLDIAHSEFQKLISAKDPRLDELSRKMADLNAIRQIPFGAQAARSDTPILQSEVISALLTEDLETIRAYSTLIGALGGDFRAEAQSIADRAIKDGLPRAYADERLNALKEAWASGKAICGGEPGAQPGEIPD